MVQYQYGFGNYFSSECIPGALPSVGNSPQKVPYGLYAEQLSGSAFTCLRENNLYTWCYRIRPSVKHSEFQPFAQEYLIGSPFTSAYTPPTQMRWDALPYPQTPVAFIQSLKTFAGNGSIQLHQGAAIHLYATTASMHNEYFYNADGDLLIVLQEGDLLFRTEMGLLEASSGEIVVIPRGIKFQVQLLHEKARGYICENFAAPFRLPELGIIGANGLAHPRHFAVPQAYFENSQAPYTLLAKFQGNLWQAQLNHSPLDVVAWHGNYLPYKYDLRKFNTINTVSYDHLDPSIFTVLSAPSEMPGIANVDFVIFPPRWMVATDTFRPPYFHRNIMSEYMGLIEGTYDAKKQGFIPGGSSLHNCMSAHGPDAKAYTKAITHPLSAEYYAQCLAFMFESRFVWQLTPFAYQAAFRQKNYLACWQDLAENFIREETSI